MARRLVAVCCFAALLAGQRTAWSSTIVPPTFEQLVDGAREIFVGRTVSRLSRWVDTRDGRAIVTVVTFRIEESLKGGLMTETSLEFLGGMVGDTRLVVAGVPEFNVGDHDVIFVGNRQAVSPVTALGYGRFRVVPDPTRMADEVRFFDGAPLVATSSVGRARQASLKAVQSLSLSAFRDQILQRVRIAGDRR